MIIAIEGADGSGKSTVAQWASDEFKILLQRFPDRTTPLGHQIDLHLKNVRRWEGNLKGARFHDYREDALVFQALQVANRMEKAAILLDCSGSGSRHLICDRYYQSGLVYGGADGLDVEYLIDLHKLIPPADINILIGVSLETSRKRLETRGMLNRYDKKEPGFLNAIIMGYESLWYRYMKEGNWFIVNGELPLEKVQAAVKRIIMQRVFFYEGEVDDA